MSLQILKFLMAIFIFARLAHQQSTPEERCEIVGQDHYVCMDCDRRGICRYDSSNEVYTVEYMSNCSRSPRSYCADTKITIPDYWGNCLQSDIPECSCSESFQCIADPNNPATVIHCEYETRVIDPPCSASAIDLSKCGCASCSGDCPLVADPNGDCESYFVCDGNDLIPQRCSNCACFDQSICGCMDQGSTSTSPPTCPFLDDPNDDCESYFFFNGTTLIPLQCNADFCFDQTLCGCLYQGKQSKNLSLNATCFPGCSFTDDPSDDGCARHLTCDNSGIVIHCQDNLCFNQTSCKCE